MEAAGDLDHLNILLKARSLKHGRWIEKILVQARKTLCGVGVNDLKDLTDKQLTALPNLTGPGNHATWENAILKLIASIKDGRQLVYLLKVLSYLEGRRGWLCGDYRLWGENPHGVGSARAC